MPRLDDPRKPHTTLTWKTIILALALSAVAWLGLFLFTKAATAREGATPKPIPAPASLIRERAACTSLQRCRNALRNAYQGLEWSKRQRLHQRSLPASNLTPVEVGRELALRHGWTSRQFDCLYALWNRESGWQIHDRNWTSQADGIPQANPASKMASAGADYRTNAATQIRWGLGYIHARYGTPCAALAASDAHGYY